MKTLPPSFRLIVPFAFAAIAGCAPAQDPATDAGEEDAVQSASNDASTDETLLMADTAWLSVGSDGSVQTTFLDTGGRYRDFRNGEAADAGSWASRPDGSICFTPEGGLGDCWTSGKLEDDGSTIVTSAGGKRVAIKRITYIAPPSDDDAEDQTGESS